MRKMSSVRQNADLRSWNSAEDIAGIPYPLQTKLDSRSIQCIQQNIYVC